jgi:hypothetical protein
VTAARTRERRRWRDEAVLREVHRLADDPAVQAEVERQHRLRVARQAAEADARLAAEFAATFGPVPPNVHAEYLHPGDDGAAADWLAAAFGGTRPHTTLDVAAAEFDEAGQGFSVIVLA